MALLALSASSVLSALAADSVTADSDPFPELEALRPNVEFWSRVFGEWSQGQVAIHDLEYPEVLYEVIDLPGPIEPTYTEEQKRWIKTMREDWEGYLYELEHKVVRDEPLEEIDRQWAQHIERVIGPDKLRGAHRRVRSQRGLRERFRDGLQRSSRFDREIREIMRDYGLPEDLAYLPHVESSFQYRARSSAGATGIWQFTRGTGKRYLKITSAIDERLDPIAATHGAAQYLKDAFQRLGTWPIALTSYNHGVHGMSRAVDRFGTDFERIFREYDGRHFGFASKNFYAEFLAVRRIASEPEIYFPEGYEPEPEASYDSIVIEHRVTPNWISSQFDVPLDQLAAINLAWSRRAVSIGLKLPVGTTVWLPGGTLDRAHGEGGSGGPVAEPSAESHPGALYVVEPGDTLSDIAARHGIDVADLRRYNGMKSRASLIHAGQTLRLAPQGGDRVHVVRRGETLSEIASMYDVTLGDLRAVNDMSSRSSLIRVGQELTVPLTDPVEPQKHVVRGGESLSRIASRYSVRLIDLLSVNALTMQSIIRPGQILLIPH